MTGRRAVVGLSLLSALLFCAFVAQSASAAKATNTTLVTCVSEPLGKGDFKDAHCDEKVPGTGFFKHSAPVKLDQTTEVSATNSGVTNGTKDHEPAVLKSKIGLTAVEITCTKVKNNAKESLIHNAQTETTKHTITGTGVTQFEECTVTKPLKCTVKQPIQATVTGEAVEKLGAAENEMGVELKGHGEGETFAEITFEGAECSLKGKTFKITGSVIGTSGPTTASSQTNHWSGATAVYTPEKEMQKLKLGVEKAEFSLITTATENTTKTPLAATTCTATEAKC
jgi:hypothetical protein